MGISIPKELLKIHSDIPEWPERWMGMEEDILKGERMLEVLIPFLLDLVEKGYKQKTLKNHFDNMWVLGGEMIRDLQWEEDIEKIDIRESIFNSIGPHGGPVLHSAYDESEQPSFDGTCRKLYKFMLENSNE